VGTGVKLTGIDVRYSQGALSTTGQTTDLGISGNGFFRVRNVGDVTAYATRVGTFRWDDQGYLVNAQGMRAQGLTGDVAAPVTSLSTAVGDVQLSSAAALTTATKNRQSVSIDRAGQVVEFYSDGTNAVVGQMLIQNFAQPSMLMNRGEGLYTALAYAGPQGNLDLSDVDNHKAGTNGLGTIEAGTLELSNVDLTAEFANMITAQRSFQAASRLVTTSDSVLEEIVNLKR
jgi:flagellar hook protein FlgE